MDEGQDRTTEIKYLKGFAILAILLGHTSIGVTHVSGVNGVVLTNVILETFSQFALPLFVIVLGFLLSVRTDELISQHKNISKRRFFIKQLGSILPIYIIFSSVYLLVQAATSYLSGEALPTAGEVIYQLLTAGTYYHLWYFALLIQLILIYPAITVLYHRVSEIKDPINLVLGALILQIAWNTGLALCGGSVGPVTSDLAGKFLFTHIFYFMLGIYTCHHFKEIREWFRTHTVWWMLIPVTAITVILSATWVSGLLSYGNFSDIPETWFISAGIIIPLYYILISGICFRSCIILSEKKGIFFSMIRKLSSCSFGIFLIHPLVMLALNRTIFPGISISYGDWIYYPLLFASALILSYILVQFIRYLPHSSMIIGVEPVRNTISLSAIILPHQKR